MLIVAKKPFSIVAGTHRIVTTHVRYVTCFLLIFRGSNIIFIFASILQQAHWPTHMSTCAQNQSNQDEDGPGGDSNEGNSHEAAAQHFLSTSQSSNGAASRSNGLPAQPSRGMQVKRVKLRNL